MSEPPNVLRGRQGTLQSGVARGEPRRGESSLLAVIGALGLAFIPGCYTGLPPGEGVGDSQADSGGQDAGSDESEGESDDGDDDPNRPPDAPEVPLETVPDALDMIDSVGFCRTVGAGSQVAGISPDGFLWLSESVAGGQSIRFSVIDPWTEVATDAPSELELGDMMAVLPQSDQDAVVVSADELWHVEAWSRISLVPPEAFNGAATACGNPRTNGGVLVGGTLFEHRSDGWWGLTPNATDEGVPNQIVTLDGECNGPADETWLSAPDGTLWRVSAEAIVKGLRFEGFEGAAGTGDTLGVLADGELWLGPTDWTRWDFEAGMPTSVAASDGRVWVTIGSRLIGAKDGAFAELAHEITGDIERALPYGGGVWLQSGDQVCHQAIGPQFRIGGVHPYIRSDLTEQPVSVTLATPGATVTGTVDGEALAFSADETGVSAVANVEGLGWHEVAIVVEGASATVDRSLWIRREVPEVVSYAADVAPIAEAHCSGETCHSGTAADVPALQTLEAWTEHATAIEERVVALDNMPPPGARSEEWGGDEIETIAKWIEGGMLP